MAYCMLVEVNTLFLILKRTLPSLIFEALFYLSWVALRNIMYPYSIWAFYKEVRQTNATRLSEVYLTPKSL